MSEGAEIAGVALRHEDRSFDRKEVFTMYCGVVCVIVLYSNVTCYVILKKTLAAINCSYSPAPNSDDVCELTEL